MRDVNLAIHFFRMHFQNVSCERCKEVAGQLLLLLEGYSRLLNNAENYKLERLRLLPRMDELAKQFGLNLGDMLKKENSE